MKRKMFYILLILMATVLFGVIDFAIALVYTKGAMSEINYGEILFHSIIIASIGTMISMFFEIKEPLEKSHKSIEDLGEHVAKSVESIGKLTFQAQSLTDLIRTMPDLNSFKNIRLFVQQNRLNTVGKLLNQWHEEITIKELSVDKKSFKVTQQALALRSYEIFWELLVREQQEKTRKGEKSLNVLVIHATSWAVWTKFAVRDKLLAKHKEFCDSGGKVTRILCAKGEEPDKDIKSAASNMKKHKGVSVLYYDINSAGVNFNFSWDFLYVEETQVAVIWNSAGPLEEILTSTYQVGDTFDNKNLKDLWDNIEKNVEDKYRDEAQWWNGKLLE